MKWIWITLGALLGTPVVWNIYIFLSSLIVPIKSDEGIILRAIIFATTATVICAAIILGKLNDLKKILKERASQQKNVSPKSKPAWTCVCCGTENRGDASLCANCNTQREWSNRKAQEEK